jgi:simple sugar transport system ATP-binding protein
MVHQHFMLVGALTNAENFALGTLDSLRGSLDLSAVSARLGAIAQELGWSIDPDVLTGSMPVGAQQRLEIVKALAGDARVLILDEPTAVLSPNEVEDLFRVVRRLRDEGRCVVLIAHKLSEVLSVADRVTVLRRGEVVATAHVSEVDANKLATWMVGEVPPSTSPTGSASDQVLLAARGLRVRGERGEEAVRGATFEVRAGEVLGIGGVDGNGQIELAEALAGIRAFSGETVLNGTVGYIPQDRHLHGLALDMSVLDNFLIGAPFVRRRELTALAQRLVEDFDIRIGSLGDPVRSLSGGNQQKLVVSRVLGQSPRVVVAHNPTRGLDVRAAAYVQSRLLRAADEGAAVVIVSTDLDELAAVATRTVYIKRGELFEGGAEAMVG